MNEEPPKLDLLGWGQVDAIILWNEGSLFKISFIDDAEGKQIREVFHYKEILNFKEIYIGSDLKIKAMPK